MPAVRHLAAILAADVAGYSRLMGVDEEGTHERLKAHLAELVNRKIAERRGRIVKNTGDGFLAEFASVVDAVRCAAEVQRGMAERNAGAPAEERIEFRVAEGTAGVRTPSASSTVSGSPPVAAPRLSIVVLPFTNLSDDREQQYFADGITADLTTDLSRISGMFVISRNTAFTYRSKPADTKQIGRELGVRYVLEGSVRRSGSQTRINAQLIDAETDAHVWAEWFDHDIGDLFALQNEITSRIANTLGIELVAAEAARPTEHPTALDYLLRGRAARLKPNSRDVFAEAISLLEHALVLDPQSIEAQSLLAGSLVSRVMSGLTDSAGEDIARAEGLVGQALAASPRHAYTHLVKARVLRAQNRWEQAVPEYETALALNRNLLGGLLGLAWCRLLNGALDEVIPLAERAIRLSPRDPEIASRYHLIGIVHLLQSRTDEAILWLERGRSAMPTVPFHHSWLASAYALKGETERAAAELEEARRLAGECSFSSIADVEARAWRGVPKIRTLLDATYLTGLRKAGMPEEKTGRYCTGSRCASGTSWPNRVNTGRVWRRMPAGRASGYPPPAPKRVPWTQRQARPAETGR
jgi:adenylate cyclase